MAAAQTTGLGVFLEEIVQLKWRLLIFGCILTFGSYYIYDFPGSIGMGHDGSIEAFFYKKGKVYTNIMNQSLYSVYSWPNTVLAIFGGLLIDKYLGLRKAMLLFCSLVFLGSVLFYIGVLTTDYALMIVGRVCFGLGGESLSVSQSSLTSRWFRGGRGMALAMGITVSFSRVGSSVNFFLSPVIAEKDVPTAALLGVFACLLSLVSCLIIIAIDVYGTRKGVVPPENKDANSTMNIREALLLPRNFWFISLICVSIYCAIFPFTGVAKIFFEQKFNIDGPTASSYTALYQISSAAGSPVVGFVVDNIGRFTYFMGASSLCFALVHVVFLCSKAPAFVMMPVMGVVYSFMVSSLWPSVAYAVPGTLVGMGYGVMTAMQNTGLAIYPLIVGQVLDMHTPPMPTNGPGNCSERELPPNVPSWAPGSRVNCTNSTAPLPTIEGFNITLLMFMGAALCGLVFAVCLYISDSKATGGMLAGTPDERKAKMILLDGEKAALLAAQTKAEDATDAAAVNKSASDIG